MFMERDTLVTRSSVRISMSLVSLICELMNHKQRAAVNMSCLRHARQQRCPTKNKLRLGIRRRI